MLTNGSSAGGTNMDKQNNMSLARENLLSFASAARYSLRELSRTYLNKNPSYLQNYVKKGSPKKLPEEDIAVISDVLGCDPADLRESAVARGPGATDPASKRPLVANQARPVPVRSHKAAGGGVVFCASEEVVEWVARPGNLVAAPNAFAVRAVDHTFAPTLLPGDTIFVNPAAAVSDSDPCAVIYRGGRVTLGRLVSKHGKAIKLLEPAGTLDEGARREVQTIALAEVQSVAKVVAIHYA